MLKKILLIGSLTKHEAHGVSLGFEHNGKHYNKN